MTALLPGLHADIPAAMYHADPCETPSLSASIAKTIARKSLLHAHYEHPALGAGSTVATKEMSAGTMMHALVLPGQDAEIDELDFDAYRSKDAKEAKAKSLAAGRVPILKHKLAPLTHAALRIRAGFAAHGIELTKRSELCAVWESPWTVDGETQGDVLCRGLIDNWDADNATIYDLKTCESAHPKALQKAIEIYGYHIQEAAYREAIETLFPELVGRVRFVFLFAELEPPFAVTPAETTESMRTVGRVLWEKAKESWTIALRDDVWPGYTDGVVQIEASPWALDALIQEEQESDG